MNTNTPGTGNEFRKPDVLHRIACTCGVLLVLYCLLMCILSFGCARQDARKYGDLGFDYPFYHYLAEYDFPAVVVYFLCVTAELLLYRRQCRRMEEYVGPSRGSIWYFSVVLVIHAAVCVYANTLSLPEVPSFSDADVRLGRFRFFANTSILPSVLYLVRYLFRSWKLKSGADL